MKSSFSRLASAAPLALLAATVAMCGCGPSYVRGADDPTIDRAVFKASGGYALPTIWVNNDALIGAQSREELENAIDGALAHMGS